LQLAGKTQIVARLMVDELAFYGIHDTQNIATCLSGTIRLPARSVTRSYVPEAFDASYRPLSNAHHCVRSSRPHIARRACQATSIDRWSRSYAPSRLSTRHEIKDAPAYCPEPALWFDAEQHRGYIQSRHATGRALTTAYL
jgi:hypothetical protein